MKNLVLSFLCLVAADCISAQTYPDFNNGFSKNRTIIPIPYNVKFFLRADTILLRFPDGFVLKLPASQLAYKGNSNRFNIF